MRVILTSALVSLCLASTPVSAQVVDDKVSFSQAMACSSLYTVLAAAVEGEPEYDDFVDVASRWLLIATNRDGRVEIVSEAELSQWVASLDSELQSENSDAEREAFLFEGIDECEANYQLIAEEFDSIDMG